MAAKTEPTRCTWCLATADEITRDHVFPVSVGGTLQVSVPACKDCQGSLKLCEQELARRSDMALVRQSREFSVRAKKLKKDPASGALECEYLLRKRDDGGYDEVGLQGGKLLQLSSIELDTTCLKETEEGPLLEVAKLRGHRRGPTADSVNGLVDAMLAILKGPPNADGLVGELSSSLFEGQAVKIPDDPDFWPRVYLDLKGVPRLRARDAAEALRFVRLFFWLGERLKTDGSAWQKGETPAGAKHELSIQWDYVRVARVLAKIAYGLAVTHLPEFASSPSSARIREFVRQGSQDEGLVEELAAAGSLEKFADKTGVHVAAVDVVRGELIGYVSVYGARHRVRLGTASSTWPGPVAAVCTPRQAVEIVSGQRAAEAMKALASS